MCDVPNGTMDELLLLLLQLLLPPLLLLLACIIHTCYTLIINIKYHSLSFFHNMKDNTPTEGKNLQLVRK